jgi:predicted DNA-binding transcriptional regulator AlpA
MWTSDIEQVPLPTKVSNSTPEPSTPITASIRFIRLPEVMELTSLCRSAVLALEGFPKPVPLGSSRARAWVFAEVLGWMDAQMASRHTQSVGEL